jgi:membrane carboxypeptidase/penicillin-binding protein
MVALCTITQQLALNLHSENEKILKRQQNVTISFLISEILEAGAMKNIIICILVDRD